MKKMTTIFIFLMLTTSILKADFKQDLSKNFLKSLGSAAATAAQIPANEVLTVANAFYNGDFKTAFSTIANYATDEALGLIPIYGQAKFATDLVKSFGNVLFTYIGNEVTMIAWQKFMALDNIDKINWLNGDYEPTIDEIKGIAYVDKDNLRKMFKEAWEEYKKKTAQEKIYLQYVAKITKVLKMANEKLEPDLLYPQNGATVKLNTSLEIWKSKNNLFKLTIHLPDGQASVLYLKDSDPEKSKTIYFKLSSFKNLDWKKLFNDEKYSDGVPVTINVDSAVYDYTGLMKSIMPDMITPGQNIVKKGDPVLHTEWNLKVISNSKTCKGNLTGNMSFTLYINLSGETVESYSIDPTSVVFTCYEDGIAKLNLDGEVISGSCEKNVGHFSVPSGSLVFHITTYCDPIRLSFYSTGYIQEIIPDAIQNEDGSTMNAIIKVYNVKGSLH